MDETLSCGKCRQSKPETDFYKKVNSRGRSWTCRTCELAIKSDYYARHRRQIIERVKAHTGRNREARAAYDAQYFLDHRSEKRTYKREYMRARLAQDPQFKLLQGTRDRIRKALKRGYKKASRTAELVGCTMAELRAHIEAQFQPAMTWANQGADGWEIDHRRPCASFDLSRSEEQRACFHYTNLQPLWKADNRKKSSKW